MNRQEALKKIKKAYENKELGFQRGAEFARYYDKKTDSCCAVGVLMEKTEGLFDEHGNIEQAFTNSHSYDIDRSMKEVNILTFHGMEMDELKELQHLHDDCINKTDSQIAETSFYNYLYALR